MRVRLISILEHARADLLDAIDALQHEDLARAQAQLNLVREHFERASRELSE